MFKYIKSQGIHFDTYTKLNNSTVTPAVDYAAAVWASKTYADCENVQHKAIITFLGTGKKSPLPAIVGNMGWTPVHKRQQKEIVRHFIRLCILPDERLEKIVFNWDYSLCAQGKKNWCKDANICFINVIFMRLTTRRTYLVYHCLLFLKLQKQIFCRLTPIPGNFCNNYAKT